MSVHLRGSLVRLKVGDELPHKSLLHGRRELGREMVQSWERGKEGKMVGVGRREWGKDREPGRIRGEGRKRGVVGGEGRMGRSRGGRWTQNQRRIGEKVRERRREGGGREGKEGREGGGGEGGEIY